MKMLLLVFLVSPALAAAKIEALTVKPGATPSDVEIAVSVTRGGADCAARIEFGDGRSEVLDFGLATTHTLKHTYRSGGAFTVSVKGTGKRPCEGVRDVPVKIAAEEKKQAEATKSEQKTAVGDKSGKKKAEKKKAAQPAPVKRSDTNKDQ